MRLWHVDMLEYLPNPQIRGQWKECFEVRGAIIKHGYPKHSLVNCVLDYPIEQFKAYTRLVYNEIIKRNKSGRMNYNIKKSKLDQMLNWQCDKFDSDNKTLILFEGWHDIEYLKICSYNLLEKYRRSAIDKREWETLYEFIKTIIS